MNARDRVILFLAGEEQRGVLSKKFIEALQDLLKEHKMMQDRLPIITEEFGNE